MNPSSLMQDYNGAKAPACRQAGKKMNRNRLGDELGVTNKLFGFNEFNIEIQY